MQEHWLFAFETSVIKLLFPKCNFHIKYIDDSSPIPQSHHPRGTAGVLIIWNNELDDVIEPLEEGSDRVVTIRDHTSRNDIVLINTYMPSDGTHTDANYASILDEVYKLYQKFSPGARVIWTGDMNASPERHKTKNDKMFTTFCKENNLIISPHTPNEPTFHHFNGKSFSKIDYFVHHKEVQLIQQIEIDTLY